MAEFAPHRVEIESAYHQILRHPREARPAAPASDGDDRVLHEPELGIMGVFDGISTDPYSDVAAELTMQHVRKNFEQGYTSASAPNPKAAAERLATLLTGANKAIHESDVRGRGHTTATVAQIAQREDATYLLLAHIGNSSAFHYNAARNHASKLTVDEGEGDRLDRFLGVDVVTNRMHTVLRCGAIALHEGDWVLLATDGVTNKYPASGFARRTIDPSDTGRLATIMLRDARLAGNATKAARLAVENARGDDDATALAIRVVGA